MRRAARRFILPADRISPAMRYGTPPFHCRAAAMLPLLLMPPRRHYASPHSCHMLMNIDYASSYVLPTPFSPR
jgi:hypothetical protein